MQIVTKEEVDLKPHLFIKEMLNGKLFIHPTDTIFGIGAIANLDEPVKRIREIKKSPNPFSIIVPNLKWVYENCEVNRLAEEWLKRLPGPYTLVLKLKNKKAVSQHVNNGKDTIGIRLPNHWFSRIIKQLNYPFVSTAATRSEGTLIEGPEDLEQEHIDNIHYFIHHDVMLRKPSIVVDLSKNKPIILRR
ncbi:MAG: hypothetical protein PWP03_408 [Candidatus Woesearchaeota archaeon]|nr:hypothetical protein [Candidatus Woesearchaeota archaeon]MDN5327770.1 hypothetical protein [Candidatus Woesearchaeota archaeon]